MGTMTAEPFADFGREAYLSLADELSADPGFLAEADPTYVKAARAFASRLAIEWPPYPDIDIALDVIWRAEEDER
jgi:hypothetical protein